MKKQLKSLIIMGLLLPLIGCSVFMAAKQPDKKDLSLFTQGIPRGLLLAEFGLPIHEEEKDGKRQEIFKFNKGYTTGAKVSRAVFHGVADVFTWGLWEVIGTPAEGAFTGNEMAYQVIYDENDKIETVILLKEK